MFVSVCECAVGISPHFRLYLTQLGIHSHSIVLHMRLIQILKTAENLNYQLVEANTNGSHTIQFVKDNVVRGHITSTSQGTSWNLPSDLA